ncbi:MAG: spore coat protein [Eubacterium sp.]|nr:spore coat protein [Eubacterium sp.]
MNGNAEKQMIKDVLSAEEILSVKYNRAISQSGTTDLRNKLIFAHDEVQQTAGTIIDEAVNRGWFDSVKADKELIKQMKYKLDSEKKLQ